MLLLRVIFRTLIVVAAFSSQFGGVILNLCIVIGVVLAGVGLSYYEYRETRIQPASDELQTVLEQQVLDRLVEEYDESHSDPPEIRVNVMLLRRRNWKFWQATRRVYPWEQTMRIEASCGDYDHSGESSLEWRTHEGVAGAAVNERASEVWTDLDGTEPDVQAEWKLTDEQYARTSHLNSVLSVPIYLPSDEEKTNPVGVLNLDSTARESATEFDTKHVRETAIYYANVIGAIVE